MESEMNNQNWNDDFQPQEHQENPCEQPEIASGAQSQWMQQSWLNIKATTWLKCFIIVAVLTTAALIAPKFTSADKQLQNSSSAEDEWYYEDFLDEYGCNDYGYDDYGYEN